MIKRISRRLLLAGSGVGIVACKASAAANRKRRDPLDQLPTSGRVPTSLRLGVTPSAGTNTAQLLDPLKLYLSRRLKLPVEIETAESYDHLQKLVADTKIDVGVFSPMSFILARRSGLPAAPLVTATRRGSPTYLGYLVSRPDFKGDTLEQLRGKSIAWVNKASTSGYLLPRLMLKNRGISDVDAFFGPAVFAGNHLEALRRVLAGDVDVAAVASSFVDPGGASGPEGSPVQVLMKTRRMPLDIVVVRYGVERQFAEKLRHELIALNASRGASSALTASWGMGGFVWPTLEQYEVLEKALPQ